MPILDRHHQHYLAGATLRKAERADRFACCNSVEHEAPHRGAAANFSRGGHRRGQIFSLHPRSSMQERQRFYSPQIMAELLRGLFPADIFSNCGRMEMAGQARLSRADYYMYTLPAVVFVSTLRTPEKK